MSTLYNKYIDQRKLDTKTIQGFDTFIPMFNGLQEIGGDTVKYKNIPSCLPSDFSDQIKMEICCIVVLAKPSGVVFAGLTAEEKRQRIERTGLEVTALSDRLAKEEQIAKLETLMSNSVIDKDVLKAMQERCVTYKAELANLIAEELINNPDGAQVMFDANSDQASQDGNSIGTGSLESVCFDESLARWLPKLTASELKNQTKEARAASIKARTFWKKEFKDVNMSKVKRIALLSLQLRKQNTPQALQWKKNHKGKPTQAKPRTKESEETKRIFIEIMNDFKACKKEWSTKEIKAAFNRTV
jgi:hypothetical protein